MRHLLLLVLLAALPACLPDTLTDDALHAKVEAATASTGGPLCGNSVVDTSENETCDDGNTDSCDACDRCQMRTVLDCKDAKSLAGLTTLGPLLFDNKQNWSAETWFQLRAAPQKLPAPFLVIGVPDAKAGTSLTFSMGVTPTGNGTVAYCGLEKMAKSTSITANVTAGSWHHLRCVWNAKNGDITAALDGVALAGGDKVFAKGAPAFDAGSWLLLGQVPARDAVTGAALTEPFNGLLDELRVALGADVATTPLARRYGPETPGTVLLYHMDPITPGRFLNDASPSNLDADQITLQNSTPIKRDAVLSFQPEACYGYSAANATCQANPKPPWCL